MFGFVKHLFKLQFIAIVLAVILGVLYTPIIEQIRNFYHSEAIAVQFQSIGETSDKIFTKIELAAFNGQHNSPIYLAILGSVYDVTKGAKHYGPGGSYNYFVGRDASVSFISGEFENYDESSADDVLALENTEDLLGLAKWKDFYDKDYKYVGKVVGRFYNEKGEVTQYHHKFLALVQQARDVKAQEDQTRQQFPDCNVEWSVEKNTRVWCTTSSGGKERNWIGHPRKLYQIGSTKFRCACIKDTDLHSNSFMLDSYENCEPTATECFYKVD